MPGKLRFSCVEVFEIYGSPDVVYGLINRQTGRNAKVIAPTDVMRSRQGVKTI